MIFNVNRRNERKIAAKIKGVHFQNYSYLSSSVPNSAKPDFESMHRHNMFTKVIQFITHQI